MGCCTSQSKNLHHGSEGDGEETAQEIITKQSNKFKENLRAPTDIIFLVFFVILLVFLIIIGLYAFVEGHPERFLNGIDSEGRVCGHDPGVEGKPFLLYFDLTACAHLWRIYDLESGFDLGELFSCPTPQVCVSECPRQYDIGIRTTGVAICVSSVNTTRYEQLVNLTLTGAFSDITTAYPVVEDLTRDIFDKKCAPYYIATTPLGGRCVPSVVDTSNIFGNDVMLTNQNITDYPLDITSISLSDVTDGTLGLALVINLRQFIVDVLSDFNLAWPGMIITIVSTAIISFLIILLMRFLVWIIVPLGIILCVVAVGACVAFAYYEYAIVSGTLNVTDPITAGLDQIFMERLRGFQYQKETWLTIAIIGTVVFLLLLLFILCLIPNIIQVIRVIGVASKAIWGVPESLFLPFLSWLLIILLFALWTTVAVFLPTTSELHYKILLSGNVSDADRMYVDLAGQNMMYSNGTSCNIPEFNARHSVTGGMLVLKNSTNRSISEPTISCQFSDFDTSPLIIVLEIYLLFMFLWLSNFIIALTQCSLAGGFAIWYFLQHKLKQSVLCKCALLRGFLKALIFHTGSLAMGSLIIAVLQFIEFILVFIIHRLRSYSHQYKFILWILRALVCVTFCVEKFLKYVNRVVYIEIAIYGTGFCTSVCKALKLFISSPIKFAVKDTLTVFTLFLLRIATIALSAVIAYFLIVYNSDVTRLFYHGRILTYSLAPLIFVLFVSFIISTAFLSVYSMAIDTIFICTLEDKSGDIGKEFEIIRKSREMKPLPEEKVHDGNMELSRSASPKK